MTDHDRVREALGRHGGVGTPATLGVPKRALARATADGCVVRERRGRYALPSVAGGPALAHAMSGVLSHASAALAWGWPVAVAPAKTHVMVPPGRRVRPVDRRRCRPHYGVLSEAERRAGRTAPLRTVLDCAAVLPFAEAVAVADSALRSEAVGQEELRRAAALARGPAVGAQRRVAGFADGRAANPFESGMRALCAGVDGLNLVPQVVIVDAAGLVGRVDLADGELGLVVECDGFEFHGGRAEFLRDRRRYTRLTLLGWVVVSVVWEDVFGCPAATAAALAAWVDRQRALYPAGRPATWVDSIWSGTTGSP